MLEYNEALKIILEQAEKINLKSVKVKLDDSIGYVLAEDIKCDIDYPSFNFSTMDGYAVKYSKNISEWIIKGEITAGNYKRFAPTMNECLSIMTGGKIPDCLDTVIPIEDVVIEGNKIRLINIKNYKYGKNIKYCGEDSKKGDIVLNKNLKIDVNNITTLAACGKAEVKVFDKIKIGVLSTGDELIDISQKPKNDKIRNTNLYSILSCIKKSGMTAVNLGVLKDDQKKLKLNLEKILKSDIDILITTGGVSVGTHDYLPVILDEIGAERKLWKVNIKPGKPLLFNVYKSKNKYIPIFSLPGNPVSSFVNFLIFIRPFIDKIYQCENDTQFPGILYNGLTKKDKKTHFVLGNSHYNSQKMEYIVERIGKQSSGDVISISKANCLIVFDSKKSLLEKGERVTCIKI